MTSRGRVLAACATLCLAAACGGDPEPDTPVLVWLTPPDRANVAALAQACSQESDGRYRIVTEELPSNVDERRIEVLDRLRGRDSSIDILGVDTGLTAELDAAGLLTAIPQARVDGFSQDVFEVALAASTIGDDLVTVPWWYDPQLLWFRGSSAERAALDPAAPVTWSALLTGARQIGGTVQIDQMDGDGTTAWVNALMAGAGSEMIEGTGRDPKVELGAAAGQRAAEIVTSYATSGVGPGPSDRALRDFASPGGAFLLAPASVISDPALATIGAELRWTAYPVVESTPAAPASGIGLGVPQSADRATLSFDAISCLTSTEVQVELMTTSGHAAARATAFDDESVAAAYPTLDVVRTALETAAAEPVTPWYSRLREAIDRTWEPTAAVSTRTPAASADLARALIGGELR